jgi:MoaA/NifB/PqqE/SkfB family radical SAM enzyme
MRYLVLYRGPLSSCNYGCNYCPFAKRDETYAQLEGDRNSLARFLDWIDQQRQRHFGVLFTPWGEALIRRWYQEALMRLTHLPHIDRAAIQTNLSCDIQWVKQCKLERLALWTTFHPSEIKREFFVMKVKQLVELGVRMSVGVVGLQEHFQEIECLRNELPPDVYLWINSYKREADYYTSSDLNFLTSIDALFPINNQQYASHGEACHAGETSFTVDGDGQIRRCHFVSEPLTNIDQPDWELALRPRTCPNATCGCYIGYVHLKRLKLYEIYGQGILERIPS